MHEPDLEWCDASGAIWIQCSCRWRSLPFDTENEAWQAWERHYDRETDTT